MKLQLDWLGDAAFRVETESGHQILMDGPPEHGGKNSAARPMEVFLSAAAACSAFDVAHILKKGRHSLASLSVRVDGERAETEPKIFTRIHLHFIAGGDVGDNAVERAAKLSVEKYCSALRMLSASCPVSFSWEIKSS